MPHAKISKQKQLGASMGRDLGPASPIDSEAVAEAKEQIEEIIRGWLSEADNVA